MGKAAALFGIASWGVVARPEEWPGWLGLAVVAFVLGVADERKWRKNR